MEFIKKMKENENEFLGFKTHEPFPAGEVMLQVKANSMASCTPKEDLALEKYSSMEVIILKDGESINVDNVLPSLDDEYREYKQEDSSYANVPVEKIEKLYQTLIGNLEVEKESNESVDEEKKKTVKNKANQKISLTKKQGVKKINAIQKALNKKFFEREEEIEGMLVALLTGQHVLLVGEPGTGKSLLSMELSKIIDGSSYFQWLLTKYTTPEELFGALSLKELEKGIHYRNTSGKLPEAHFTFLDEIFKANSAILNSLLTLINERLYYNNGTPIESPLISLIGASNEYPEEDEGLEAMFDRLLLRYEVNQIKDRNNFISMLKNEGSDTKIPSIKLEELYILQNYTSKVNVSDKIYESISNICLELEDEGIRPSARRVKNSVKAIKAKAFMDGRDNVEEKDLSILTHILWNDIHEKEEAVEIITRYAQDIVENTLDRIKKETNELVTELSKRRKNNEASYEDVTEVAGKLKSLSSELVQLEKDYSDRKADIKAVLKDIQKKQQEIIDEVLLPIEP